MIDRAQLDEAMQAYDQAWADEPEQHAAGTYWSGLADAVLALVGPEIERRIRKHANQADALLDDVDRLREQMRELREACLEFFAAVDDALRRLAADDPSGLESTMLRVTRDALVRALAHTEP